MNYKTLDILDYWRDEDYRIRIRQSINKRGVTIGIGNFDFIKLKRPYVEVNLNEAIPEKKLAYIAGLVDGEGSVLIEPSSDRTFRVELQIVNTDKRMIDFVKESLGIGRVHSTPIKGGRKKILWRWNLVNNHATLVMKLLLPYLIVKKEQALLCIQYRKEYRNLHTVSNKNEVIKRRKELYLKVKELNH